MPISVQIPSTLKSVCGGARELTVSAATVREALDELKREHPAVYRSVCDETGALRRHINLFINDHHLAGSDELETALDAADVLFIMPAVSGG